MQIKRLQPGLTTLVILAAVILTACRGQPPNTNKRLVAPGDGSLSSVQTWSQPRLEISQANLVELEISSQALAVVDLKPPAPVVTTVSPTPVEPALEWPVEGRLSQPFGCSPFYTALPGPGCPAETPWFHDGIDLAVPVGTPVRAGLSGTVIFAGPDGTGPACGNDRGYGLGVVIDDGDGELQALYAHLSRIDVMEGQIVTPTTIIGASGATGCVSGPHLHFGLRLADRLVDPLTYLPKQQQHD